MATDDEWDWIDNIVETARLELLKELREKLPKQVSGTPVYGERFDRGFNTCLQEVNDILKELTPKEEV